jgi:hypothetical protein
LTHLHSCENSRGLADLTEQEEASKMQQQILQLLSLQVRELQAAYPHIVDDAAASEQIYKIFTHEADLLSTAVMDLSETMCGLSIVLSVLTVTPLHQ